MPASTVSCEDMHLLINMSLGEPISGEVNFKHLHTLLHEIVNKFEVKEVPTAAVEELATSEEVGDKVPSQSSTPTPQKPRSIVGVMKSAGELDHKLQEIENRVETLRSLDDMLERVREGSTPVQDLMDYLSLQSKIGGIESGLKGNAGLLDQLMREFKDLKEAQEELRIQCSEASQQAEQSMKALESQFTSVTGIQSGAGQASMTALTQIKEKVSFLETNLGDVGEKVQQVTGAFKDTMEELKTDTLPKKADKNDLEHYITWEQMDEAFKEHKSSPPATPIPADHPSPEVVEALRVVGELADEYENLKERLRVMEDDLERKITADDVAALLPDDSEQLMSTLLEMQTKQGDLESELADLMPKIPSDLVQKLSDLESMLGDSKLKLEALEGLPAVQEDWEKQLQEVASQLAQARERLTEVDKAMVDVANAVTEIQNKPEEDRSSIDEEKVNEMKQMVDDLHTQQHHMMETSQNANEEIAINKDLIKKLYGESEMLKESKADKEIMSLMEEKADRKQLENKASKQWVDSTFSQLDEEIRLSRAKMQEQEDALRMAMQQIGGEVDLKLNKEEIGPLKDYFDEKLRNLPQQQAMENLGDIADSAAGMRKPVRRFKCISCDRPVDAQLREASPSLPQAANLPSRQSFRPYTTYELDLIRQHQRLNQGQGIYDVLDILPSLRACGGAHTVMSTQKRLRAGPGGSDTMSPDTGEPYTVMYTGPSTKDELDLVGYDGHVYRGRNSGRLPSLKKSKSGKFPARPSTSPTSSRGSPTSGHNMPSLKV